MSQRLGMADGRCTTVNISSRIFNDEIFKKSGGESSFSHRMFLQKSSPVDVIPEANCSLFSYVKDFDIIESTNEISQLQSRD
jgi:hypothetical protein